MNAYKLTILISLTLFGCSSTNLASSKLNSAKNEIRFAGLIGSNGIDCGAINTWPFPKNKIRDKEKAKNKSIACVKKAEKLGLSFVVTSLESMPPDSWVARTYIFTAAKEKVLFEESEWGDSGQQSFIGLCKKIELLNTGKIEVESCTYNAELFKKL